MIYQVDVNVSKAAQQMSKLNVDIYNKDEVMIFVKAKSPDGACHEALKKIKLDILAINHTLETMEFVNKLHFYVSVVKIKRSSPYV